MLSAKSDTNLGNQLDMQEPCQSFAKKIVMFRCGPSCRFNYCGLDTQYSYTIHVKEIKVLTCFTGLMIGIHQLLNFPLIFSAYI